MTATERLRQLLDERGVEWAEALTDLSRQIHWSTERNWCAFTEWNDTVGIADTLTVYHLTPEQAIDATLGRGTCRMELPDLRGPAYTDVYVCSECGGEVMVGTVMGVSDVPKWCPWCGRKVEQ